jgi:SAM-dependent methyltransferase
MVVAAPRRHQGASDLWSGAVRGFRRGRSRYAVLPPRSGARASPRVRVPRRRVRPRRARVARTGPRSGLVVEIGCGSGLLTRHLVDGGHRVIATDASPAMLDLARDVVGDAQEIRRLTLPDDPIPMADAIVGVGHALNYLPDLDAIDRALIAIAESLRPGGVMAGIVHPRRGRLLAPRRRTPRQHPGRHVTGPRAPEGSRCGGDRRHVVRQRNHAGRTSRDRRAAGRLRPGMFLADVRR